MKRYISIIVLMLAIIALVICLGFCISSISKKSVLLDSATEKENELQNKVAELESKISQMENEGKSEDQNVSEEEMPKIVPGISQDRIVGDYKPGDIRVSVDDTDEGVYIHNWEEDELMVSFEDKVKEFYPEVNNEGGKIKFPAKIVDSKICREGQGIYAEVVTLLEDGTVYINNLKDIASNDYTPKKLTNVENVVRIYQVRVSTPASGFLAIAVQKIDGSVTVLESSYN